MKKPWDIIAELEAVSSRTAKEAIVTAAAKEDNVEFFEGCRLAYDALITFGVKKVEERPESGKNMPAPRGFSHKQFIDLANKLATRQLTGGAAQTAINTARIQAFPDQWNNWYRRILIKDMRAGFSESTVNKVIEKTHPQHVIPVFECQLAHDGANHQEKIRGPKMIEVKLDGVRVITIAYPNGTVNQYSRNGKELTNFPLIKEQISKHARFFAEPVVLDGEVMGATFQDLMRQVHRKSDVQADDSVLNLFDILTLREFMAGEGEHRQLDRTFSLHAWYNQFKDHMPNVSVLENELLDLDTADGQKRFAEINNEAIKGGYEGIMIKDPRAKYECKRSVNWLKQKPFIEVSLKVVDLEEGTGKNVGKLGALICEGKDDGKFIRVNVGSGFSDAQRNEIWGDKKAVLGQVVEVRADVITKSQDSDTYSLRFPRFQRFRGFEAGEKI